MWVFTGWADSYDKMRQSNDRFLKSTMKDPGDGVLGVVVWSVAAGSWYVNTVAGFVGGTFVDVLRLGDGVREGGWGYAKDALRLTTVAGVGLRFLRFAGGTLQAATTARTLAEVAFVDEATGRPACLWVAGTQALRLTGVKHFAKLADLAQAAGVPAEKLAGASTRDLLPVLKALGADARLMGTVSSFEEVAKIARANPDGVVIFGVRFFKSAKAASEALPGVEAPYLMEGGHALIARVVKGVVVIYDRTGKVYNSVRELEAVYKAAPEMGMTIHNFSQPLVINHARILGEVGDSLMRLSGFAWVANAVGIEVRSVPVATVLEPAVIDIRDSQLLSGWWFVEVDQYRWIYCFDPNGNVRWSDPFNHQSGSGKWKTGASAVEISWASKATERWSVPIMTGQQTGSYTSGGETSLLKATKYPESDWRPLVGKWQVRVSQWLWHYEFSPNGDVTWVDPFNGRSGRGSWTFSLNSIYISWTSSATREEWRVPLAPSSETGICRMAQGQFPVAATKMD